MNWRVNCWLGGFLTGVLMTLTLLAVFGGLSL